MANFFNLLVKSKRSKARLGEINTSHGVIKTPAFIPAATKGTIKSLSPRLINEIGIQAGCVNTYHLITHPGADLLKSRRNTQIFTIGYSADDDSGGFRFFAGAKYKKPISVATKTILVKYPKTE
jgi:queuine tRNA-ribosyltransferase